MKYRKKPVIIEAERWFQNGDHSKDNYKKGSMAEGKLIRRFRHPNKDGVDICSKCNFMLHGHGWIDTLEGGHRVCPGDYIIQGVAGEFYPCKPDIFKETYEKVLDYIYLQEEV